ncbi:hypothetical protein SAICODRAFT_30422 [Saitoella complicata NRRL Y-17804]|uniref:uncharacterized protein n=1 Tax=Saitoella complicata (strain BCRC 22490 / CBS 7301 / JCM 7358 / NBRC 10748 / NRRL Y-17804) TaxID=698492 RepID=UPI0008682237|nr:uncharacterized protein SAICODRAFT_30422 [Saitoella complicata NRRL Y-17804]ODQ53022.1 hypothetical protein SAICODRAFT_30422 [Saitoella complicata NRRL Y-17804]
MIETAALPLLSRASKARPVVSRPGRSAYSELLTEMKPQSVAGPHIKDKVLLRPNHDQTFSTEVSEDDDTLEIAYRVVRGNFRLGPTSITGINEWRAFLEEMEDLRTHWKLNDFMVYLDCATNYIPPPGTDESLSDEEPSSTGHSGKGSKAGKGSRTMQMRDANA